MTCISTDCECYGVGCEWCAYGWTPNEPLKEKT